MPEHTFDSMTPRFALPLLYSGQAQKEIFVNESLLLADTLLHCTVRGEIAAPPENCEDGETWLVAPAATGVWSGRDGAIAMKNGHSWTFIEPRDGLRVLDLTRGATLLYLGHWRKPSVPVEPLGGTSVDGEARTAINDLVAALQALGILPSA